MNQPGANMAGMGAMPGGPGNMNAMRPVGSVNVNQDPHKQLNTYIYDYLLKSRQYDLARTFQKSVDVDTRKATKQSPGRREVNGIDDSMDGDSKDDPARPDDLPDANVPVHSNDHSFLLDWWCQFWDVFAAQRQKPVSANGNPQTAAYLQMSKNNAQIRNDRNSHMINATNAGMMRGVPANAQAQAQMEMHKRMNMAAGGNLNPAQRQALQQAQQKNNMMSNGMQRDGSGMNMGDQRPQSPATAENAPSPSKRQRLDGNGNFGNPMGPGGRTQPMPGNPMGATAGPGGNQMMMANGMAPGDMPNQFFNGQGPGQTKAMDGMNPNGGAQPGQMGNQAMDQQSDIFTGNAGGPRGMPGGPGAPGGPQQPGNHALQDYQMQLMLLEQQNKKRLLMARQEQDNLVQPHGPGAGQSGGYPGQAPSMSPQGSRAGPSPNPADQMKRGTPKLGGNAGLPGSPMPDGMPGNRNSPAPNGGPSFDPSQMPAGMPPQFPYANGPQMAQNGMRPPSSHPNAGFGGGPMTQQQIEAMQRARGQPIPGQYFPGGQQMMPNAGQPPQNMGNPQQRAVMAPPPAPQAGGEQRTQPPSPQQNTNAPPTPQQSNKAAPKKKEKADNKKKAPAKKNSTAAQGATPASDADPPPTPTPSTPITPMHPQSFKNGQQAQNNPNQPPNAPAVQQIQQPQMDPNPGPFGLESNDPGMDMGFALEGSDVLQDFDFDSFLHTETDNSFGTFDANFGFTGDGLEAGESLG